MSSNGGAWEEGAKASSPVISADQEMAAWIAENTRENTESTSTPGSTIPQEWVDPPKIPEWDDVPEEVREWVKEEDSIEQLVAGSAAKTAAGLEEASKQPGTDIIRPEKLADGSEVATPTQKGSYLPTSTPEQTAARVEDQAAAEFGSVIGALKWAAEVARDNVFISETIHDKISQLGG